MDLLCRNCEEPWDNDELHEEARASRRTYAEVAADFAARGCKALATEHPSVKCVPANTPTTAALAAVYDGVDDLDDAVNVIEDARSLGVSLSTYLSL